jgi:hypothetical protein
VTPRHTKGSRLSSDALQQTAEYHWLKDYNFDKNLQTITDTKESMCPFARRECSQRDVHRSDKIRGQNGNTINVLRPFPNVFQCLRQRKRLLNLKVAALSLSRSLHASATQSALALFNTLKMKKKYSFANPRLP